MVFNKKTTNPLGIHLHTVTTTPRYSSFRRIRGRIERNMKAAFGREQSVDHDEKSKLAFSYYSKKPQAVLKEKDSKNQEYYPEKSNCVDVVPAF